MGTVYVVTDGSHSDSDYSIVAVCATIDLARDVLMQWEDRQYKPDLRIEVWPLLAEPPRQVHWYVVERELHQAVPERSEYNEWTYTQAPVAVEVEADEVDVLRVTGTDQERVEQVFYDRWASR